MAKRGRSGDVVDAPASASLPGSSSTHEDAARRELSAAGWIVRDGRNYGANFALYEPSDQPTHAALCALVRAAPLEPPLTWVQLQSHVRLCHQVSKGLLLCEVGARPPTELEAPSEGEQPRALPLQGSPPPPPPPPEVQMLRIASWFPGRAHGELS